MKIKDIRLRNPFTTKIVEPPKQKEVVNTERTRNVAMSGQRYELPNESNLPEVQNWNDEKGLVRLGYSGADMMLPLIIEQSVYLAPSHKSCIKLKVASAIGNGYKFLKYNDKNVDEIMQVNQFENSIIKNGLAHFIENITRDFALHNRVNIKVTRKGSFIQFERVNPSMIGYNMDISKFYYSRNFASGRIEKVYSRFQGQDEGVFMLEYDGNVDKYIPYAVPEWMSVLPNIKINSMIPQFHEANMENSVGINLVIRKPTEFESVAEKEKYKGALKAERGVKGTGNFAIFSGNGMENVAEVQQLQPNQNDKMFEQLRNSSIDDICMGHNVNPVLIGVKTPGSLGASSEFDIAYNIFYKIEVNPIRRHIEGVINDLLKTIGFTFRFELEDNQAYFKVEKDESPQQFELTKKK